MCNKKQHKSKNQKIHDIVNVVGGKAHDHIAKKRNGRMDLRCKFWFRQGLVMDQAAFRCNKKDKHWCYAYMYRTHHITTMTTLICTFDYVFKQINCVGGLLGLTFRKLILLKQDYWRQHKSNQWPLQLKSNRRFPNLREWLKGVWMNLNYNLLFT